MNRCWSYVYYGPISGRWFWEIRQPYFGGPAYTVRALGEAATQSDATTAASAYIRTLSEEQA